MSLCDFDTLALDEQGRPCDGVSEPSICGVVVEAYRDFLVVRDAPAWREGSLNPRPVVASVTDGEVTYLDVTVLARRGPQGGVYFATWFIEQGNPVGMVGCSVQGFVTDAGQRQDAYLGVLPSSVDFLSRTLREWAADKRVPGPLAATVFTGALRFNQGDAYVARGAGFPVYTSGPGDAQSPLALEYQKAAEKAQKESKNGTA